MQGASSAARQLEVRIWIDAKDQLIGLGVADGDIDWHPLARAARSLALAEGIVDPASAWDRPGVGSAVVTRTGEMVFAADSSPAADVGADMLQNAREAGRAQALEDIRRLGGAKKGQQGWDQGIEELKIVVREEGPD